MCGGGHEGDLFFCPKSDVDDAGNVEIALDCEGGSMVKAVAVLLRDATRRKARIDDRFMFIVSYKDMNCCNYSSDCYGW